MLEILRTARCAELRDSLADGNAGVKDAVTARSLSGYV
jgi:hypothetical protein